MIKALLTWWSGLPEPPTDPPADGLPKDEEPPVGPRGGGTR